jgi:hypothetical protein
MAVTDVHVFAHQVMFAASLEPCMVWLPVLRGVWMKSNPFRQSLLLGTKCLTGAGQWAGPWTSSFLKLSCCVATPWHMLR